MLSRSAILSAGQIMATGNFKNGIRMRADLNLCSEPEQSTLLKLVIGHIMLLSQHHHLLLSSHILHSTSHHPPLTPLTFELWAILQGIN